VSGIRNPELLLHQWIRLLSCLFRARCSEAVSNSGRAPSGAFDRISVWAYKPFNDAAGRTAQASLPCRRCATETLEPTIQEFGGEDSKSSNPVSVDDRTKLAEGAPRTASDLLGPPAANRHRLQNERSAITHHFAFGGHEGYLTVGFYPNGQPGEIFIRMAKAGSTIAGLMECFGTVVSVSLQHGVPLKVLCDKLSHTHHFLDTGRFRGSDRLAENLDHPGFNRPRVAPSSKKALHPSFSRRKK
jgi:hypothetical protein